MPFSSTSLAKLEGAHPELIRRFLQLEADFNAIGGDLTVPGYGGFRSFEDQAQLVQWRDEAVNKGGAYYQVAPAGTSKHETGRAADGKIVKPPPGMTEAQAYRWLADRAPVVGLVAGYWFGGGPPSKHSDPFHFELPPDFPDVQLPEGIPTGGNPIEDEASSESGGAESSDRTGASSGLVVTAIAVLGLMGVILWKRGHFS